MGTAIQVLALALNAASIVFLALVGCRNLHRRRRMNRAADTYEAIVAEYRTTHHADGSLRLTPPTFDQVRHH